MSREAESRARQLPLKPTPPGKAPADASGHRRPQGEISRPARPSLAPEEEVEFVRLIQRTTTTPPLGFGTLGGDWWKARIDGAAAGSHLPQSVMRAAESVEDPAREQYVSSDEDGKGDNEGVDEWAALEAKLV